MTSELISTPFGEQSTAAKVLPGVELRGKKAIVTGAASGIGVETVRALAAAGAEVTIAVRNPEAGREVSAQIAGSHIAHLDLADQASVATFAEQWEGPLQRYVSEQELDALRAAAAASTGGEELRWKTVEQGAATSVLLAASPSVAGVSGEYFDDCNEAPVGEFGARHGVSAHALDPEAANRLWDYSISTLKPVNHRLLRGTRWAV